MQIRENVSLRPYNTFGLEATARFFTAFQSVQELEEILRLPLALKDMPLVLGGGSNILLTNNVEGLVLKNKIGGIDIVAEDNQHVYLKAGAGVNWHQLVMYCVDNNFAGMENMALIPGNVGASPMQNIGAYGVEIKDIFHELEAFHLESRTVETFGLDACEFGYRESVFKHKYRGRYIITSVTYKLNKTPRFNTSYGALQQELDKMGVEELTLQAVAQAVIAIRTAKLPDPNVVGNAGSFFKNPQVEKEMFERLQGDFPSLPFYPVTTTHVKLPAGWLIEQCGWKGVRRGDAGCYPKQALVLVNYGRATGKEIYALSEEILQSVKDKFGIALEREVNII